MMMHSKTPDIKLFDTHAHYDDGKFDIDRLPLLESIKNSGYIKYVLNASTDTRSLEKCLWLAGQYDFMYASLGIHPSCTDSMTDKTIAKIIELARSSSKVIALGEIGLDYHYDRPDKNIQKTWFIKQIDAAKYLKLPILLHNREANADTLQIIQQQNAKDVGGVFHCYSGDTDMLKDVLNNNFVISVGGIVTFKNAKILERVVKYVPIDMLILETDCPYLTPEPYRGKRNDSRYLNLIAQKVADIRCLPLEEVASVTTSNAERLFGLR